MPIFYSTQTFRDALNKLCSKPKEGYSSVAKDICNSFKDKTIDEIRMNRDMVLCEDKLTIIKLRVPNSGQRLSKKDGFRLIYLAHKEKEEVTFLYIYPKRGKYGLVTVKDDEILSLLEEYVNEKKSSSLEMHDIDNELDILQIPEVEFNEQEENH